MLLHGRLDFGSTIDAARELVQAWPDAELVVFNDSGHTGSDAMTARKRQALDDFAG